MMHVDARIAIVGAGVSGLLTAVALKKLGFRNIVIHEKEERLTNLTYSYAYKGETFDFSTKLIPAVGLTHEGVYPPLLQLLKETGVTLQPTPPTMFYDFERDRRLAVPAFMSKYRKLKIARDFAIAFDLLVRIAGLHSIAAIHESGLVRPDENITQWACRHGIESFGTFTAYLVDLFNMGPAAQVPASFVLVSRIHFIAPYLLSVLGRKGIRHFYRLFGSRKRTALKRFVRFRPQTTQYYLVREGYQEFFSRLVNVYDLDIQYRSTVSCIESTGEGISFTVNGEHAELAEALLFACPPAAIAGLHPGAEMRALMKDIAPANKVRTWAFKAKSWDSKRFGQSAYVINAANTMGLGTERLKQNGALIYVARESAASDLLLSAVYTGATMTEEEKRGALENSLKDFGLELAGIVACRDFNWPHYAGFDKVKSGWAERIAANQGKGGIYCLGEAVSGIGVPTILEHAIRFTGQHFQLTKTKPVSHVPSA
jgi:monoamine oxidase